MCCWIVVIDNILLRIMTITTRWEGSMTTRELCIMQWRENGGTQSKTASEVRVYWIE